MSGCTGVEVSEFKLKDLGWAMEVRTIRESDQIIDGDKRLLVVKVDLENHLGKLVRAIIRGREAVTNVHIIIENVYLAQNGDSRIYTGTNHKEGSEKFREYDSLLMEAGL